MTRGGEEQESAGNKVTLPLHGKEKAGRAIKTLKKIRI